MGAISPSKLIEDDFSGDWANDMPDVFRLLNKFNSDASGALSSQIVLSQLGAQKISLTIATPDDAKALTVAAGWTSTVTPKYRENDSGVVNVYGTVTGGVLGTSMVTGLPPPTQTEVLFINANNALGMGTVNTSGALILRVGATANVDLYCVYLAAATQPYVPSCFPIKVESKLKTGQAGLVLPGKVTDLNKSGGQVVRPSRVSLAWHNETGLGAKGNVNNIVIDNIVGLLPSRTYAVTLWALPDQ